jgi:hypothetical protein
MLPAQSRRQLKNFWAEPVNGAIWLLTQVSELLFEGLATRWTVAGLDAF